MRYLTLLLTALTYATLHGVANADLVWEDSFDADNADSKSTAFFTSFTDYFGITGIDEYGGDDPPIPNAIPTFTGFDANYLVGEEFGSGVGPPVTLTWTGISIAGLNDFTFSGDFAAAPQEFEAPGFSGDDVILVEYQIDNNGFNELLRFDPDASGNLQVAGGSTDLSLASQTFTASFNNIPNGAVLDIRLAVLSNQDGEAFAIDNLSVTSAVPEASQLIALPIAGLISIGAARSANGRLQTLSRLSRQTRC